jgi:Fe2+ or Zn2+ uptake regulation protein
VVHILTDERDRRRSHERRAFFSLLQRIFHEHIYCADAGAITPAELQHADDYEVDAYRRDRVVLASGVSAWVYVDAASPRPGE